MKLALLTVATVTGELSDALADTFNFFVDTQEACDALFRELLKQNLPCQTLHGGMGQDDRDSTIADFRCGNIAVLVATSVSLNEMVNLTGQLYAAAGLLSSLINLFGTNSLQRHLGMMPLLLSSPVFLFCSALFSLVSPSIAAAFVGFGFERGVEVIAHDWAAFQPTARWESSTRNLI